MDIYYRNPLSGSLEYLRYFFLHTFFFCSALFSPHLWMQYSVRIYQENLPTIWKDGAFTITDVKPSLSPTRITQRFKIVKGTNPTKTPRSFVQLLALPCLNRYTWLVGRCSLQDLGIYLQGGSPALEGLLLSYGKKPMSLSSTCYQRYQKYSMMLNKWVVTTKEYNGTRLS